MTKKTNKFRLKQDKQAFRYSYSSDHTVLRSTWSQSILNLKFHCNFCCKNVTYRYWSCIGHILLYTENAPSALLFVQWNMWIDEKVDIRYTPSSSIDLIITKNGITITVNFWQKDIFFIEDAATNKHIHMLPK